MEEGGKKKKGGFKGKRPRSKFTRNARTGAEQKKTAPSIETVPSDDEEAVNPPTAIPNPTGRTWAATRKSASIQQLKKEVGYIKREKERVIKVNEELVQKVEKVVSKSAKQGDKIIELGDTVRGARQQAREAKIMLVASDKKLAAATKEHAIATDVLKEHLVVCLYVLFVVPCIISSIYSNIVFVQ